MKVNFTGIIDQNYPPISLACIVCKIMESIIRDQIMDYFLKNNLFNSKQYGRSAVLQLLKIMDDWTTDLNNGDQVDIIYTDFEKAFDKNIFLSVATQTIITWHCINVFNTVVKLCNTMDFVIPLLRLVSIIIV